MLIIDLHLANFQRRGGRGRWRTESAKLTALRAGEVRELHLFLPNRVSKGLPLKQDFLRQCQRRLFRRILMPQSHFVREFSVTQHGPSPQRSSNSYCVSDSPPGTSLWVSNSGEKVPLRGDSTTLFAYGRAKDNPTPGSYSSKLCDNVSAGFSGPTM